VAADLGPPAALTEDPSADEPPAQRTGASPATELAVEAPAATTARARQVLAIEATTEGAETVLVIRADAAFRERDVFAALIGPDPPRYLLRLSGIERLYRPTTIDVGTPVLDRVRIGHHDTRRGQELHVVLDLPTRALSATVERDGETLRVRLRPAAP
jgi:hypothetical protein